MVTISQIKVKSFVPKEVNYKLQKGMSFVYTSGWGQRSCSAEVYGMINLQHNEKHSSIPSTVSLPEQSPFSHIRTLGHTHTHTHLMTHLRTASLVIIQSVSQLNTEKVLQGSAYIRLYNHFQFLIQRGNSIQEIHKP